MRYYFLACVFIFIKVTAVTSKTEIILCEHEAETIRCEPNQIINILDGNYGRTSTSICTSGPINTVSCGELNTVAILSKLCNEKNSCNIYASNTVFGDPCVNTFKYLYLSYECIPQPEQKIACENEAIHLNCDSNEVINILSANYGRTNAAICTFGPIRTTNCISPSSTNIVSAICNNTNSCAISASNAVFGDPCVNTLKYLSIKYKCVTRSNKFPGDELNEIIPE